MIFYFLMLYMIIFSMFMFIGFMFLLINKITFFVEFEIVKISSVKLELLLLLDWVSMLFMSVVLMISSMVILYSIEYMYGDLNINRFIMLIMMFVLSMILMILSPNLISILIGWDGLGLVSYCLVIYYQNKISFNSGMVTVLMNRVGDILILMSIGLMIGVGSWNYLFFNKMSSLLIFMMLIAAFTKSAQIPFSSWLPLAMAAPTPVSSLVHSSTLVTAGVYLMIRLNYLLLSQNIINYMMLISVMTMFMSGLGANFEFDLKKIIALSTLSQLGIMIFCLSFKLEIISMFHLVTHAMFKALLFMCAGVIIHNMLGYQDIRFISMTYFNFPLVSIMFNCSSMSLCGIPFLSGFFSKDLILEMYMMSMFNKFIFIMLFMSMGLTMMYTIRLLFFSFVKYPILVIYYNYKMLNSHMGFSMYYLFLMSILKGGGLSWLLFSMKNNIYLPIYFKMIIYLFMWIGMVMGLILSNLFMHWKILKMVNLYYNFFSMMWFMQMLYSSWLNLIMKFSNKIIYKMDLGWIEYLFGINFMEMFKSMFKLDFFNKNYFYLLIFFMLIIMMLIF